MLVCDNTDKKKHLLFGENIPNREPKQNILFVLPLFANKNFPFGLKILKNLQSISFLFYEQNRLNFVIIALSKCF